MNYIFFRAVRRLKRNYKIYAALVLELMVGLVILATQINVKSGIKSRLEIFNQNYNKYTISLEAFYVPENHNNVGLPINVKDFEWIENLVGAKEACLYVAEGIITTDSLITIPVIATSDMDFLGIEASENGNNAAMACIGKNARKLLSDSGTSYNGENVTINCEGISIANDCYSFEILDSEKMIVSAFSGADTDKSLSDCIVISYDLLDRIEEEGIFYTANVHFNVNKIKDDNKEQDLADILDYLSAEHPDYRYSTINKVNDYEKGSDDMSSTIRLLSWISNILMVLIFVGAVGILLIILDKRKKDFMISEWVGARRIILFAELMVEMGLVSFTAGFLSILTACFIAPKVSNYRYTVRMVPDSAFFICIICLGITFFTVSIALLLSNAGKRRKED